MGSAVRLRSLAVLDDIGVHLVDQSASGRCLPSLLRRGPPDFRQIHSGAEDQCHRTWPVGAACCLLAAGASQAPRVSRAPGRPPTSATTACSTCAAWSRPAPGLGDCVDLLNERPPRAGWGVAQEAAGITADEPDHRNSPPARWDRAVAVTGREPGRNSVDLATGQRCTVAGRHQWWCRYPERQRQQWRYAPRPTRISTSSSTQSMPRSGASRNPIEGGGLWWSALEMDRCLLALTADGRPVGTAAAYSFELTLPGETLVPAAGVTAVGVLPSHRRQGVLSAMMRISSARCGPEGEFLSVLLPPRPDLPQVRYGRRPTRSG